ncbi:MAG: L-serine ammonia-lyase [Methylococcales bacterium]|nr:L-serine ammonia-lyase [Methylococcales bacterium]
MTISVFDIFKVGIGPSSSHTVGPMRAAGLFCQRLDEQGQLASVARVRVELYGSLGATGKGHGSDKAVLLGLSGELPDSVDPERIPTLLQTITERGEIYLAGTSPVDFDVGRDLKFLRKMLPKHSNGMRFQALDASGQVLLIKDYYSVGGGFVLDGNAQAPVAVKDPRPLPFTTGAELLEYCQQQRCSISTVMRGNERYWRDDDVIDQALLKLWQIMQNCVRRGLNLEGVLPGGMHVKRRARQMFLRLSEAQQKGQMPIGTSDWVNLYALAVNEENAAGGRVVTAPTNGAAGIIPAVLHYYQRFCPGASDTGVIRFLLTAGAIAILYKENASLSGAEVGCQGEVGVACSMAAGALAEVLGGSPQQVENAAEIGMEHNLGLTCDPVGGLVQVPCIERNAMGAVKAINAARLALRGDGCHFVSLDKVIKTMRDTGADMKTKYKETARGGLAVNVIEC